LGQREGSSLEKWIREYSTRRFLKKFETRSSPGAILFITLESPYTHCEGMVVVEELKDQCSWRSKSI
jgi:hypothetical protein